MMSPIVDVRTFRHLQKNLEVESIYVRMYRTVQNRTQRKANQHRTLVSTYILVENMYFPPFFRFGQSVRHNLYREPWKSRRETMCETLVQGNLTLSERNYFCRGCIWDAFASSHVTRSSNIAALVTKL